VLDTTVGDNPPTHIASDRRLLGARLREARKRRGIGVRELGRQTDCSASLISQIELGKIAPSVNTLYALTSSLGVSMDSLFVTDGSHPGGEPPEGGQADGTQGGADAPAVAPAMTPAPVSAPVPAEAGVVQRQHARPYISLQHGVRWERLNPLPEQGAEFLEVTYNVGGGSRSDDQAVRHNGREYGLVLEGVLTVQIGFESYVLQAGDSVAFDSSIPHRFWNSGDTLVRAIWFELKANGSAGLAHEQPASAHGWH
jgi:quercetin dioxygenase-like cupin family protein/DNA-binding XRE family transcriptional regulator